VKNENKNHLKSSVEKLSTFLNDKKAQRIVIQTTKESYIIIM